MDTQVKTQYNSRIADKFVVRFVEGMRSWLSQFPKDNQRSMNSQMTYMLELIMNHPEEFEDFEQRCQNPSYKSGHSGWTPAIGMLVTLDKGPEPWVIAGFVSTTEGRLEAKLTGVAGTVALTDLKPYIQR